MDNKTAQIHFLWESKCETTKANKVANKFRQKIKKATAKENKKKT